MDAHKERSSARGAEDRGVEVRSFRPAWLHVDDVPLIGWTGLWAWLGTALAVGIWLAPAPPEPGWEHFADRPEVQWLPVAEADDVELETAVDASTVEAPEPVENRVVEREVEGPAEAPRSRTEMALQLEATRERLSRRLGARSRVDLAADTRLLAGVSGSVAESDGPAGPRRIDEGPDYGLPRSGLDFETGPSEEVGGGMGAVPIPAGAAEEPADFAPSPGPSMREQPPRSLMGRFRVCYESGLRNRKISGRIRLSLEVSERRVVDVDVLEDGLDDEDVVACMRNTALRWRPIREPDGQMGPWTLIFRPK